MTETALVIGGAGFLGSHLVSRLGSEGFEVIAFDRPGALSTTARIDRIEGSVGRTDDVAGAVESTNPDVIFNLAAFGHGGKGLVASGELDPRAAVETNVIGLINTLEAARRFGCRVVWTSSTTPYAPADHYPGTVAEDDLVGPRSTYAATKVLGEQLIRTYRDHHGVDAVAVRPTLVWGPGILYRGVQAALGDMVEAAVGSAVTVPSGDEPWDLIYVKDAALALATVARADWLPPVVTVTGYVASVDDVRDAVLSVEPAARIAVAGTAPVLGFPLVDTAAAGALGFTAEYDLTRSVADYLASVHLTQANKA